LDLEGKSRDRFRPPVNEVGVTWGEDMRSEKREGSGVSRLVRSMQKVGVIVPKRKGRGGAPEFPKLGEG